MENKYPILAREGRWHIALAASAALAVHYFAGPLWAVPFWIVLVFILQFFRDPPRQIPDTPGVVICPADGKVIALGEVEDPYLKRPAKRVSVFMNVFNVHSNRIPVTGTIKEQWYRPGKFVNAALDKASLDNERNALWIRTEQGQDVVVVQVAGLIARRILCYVKPGERVECGARYGFIRFGSRVDVYLPLNAKFEVSLGDSVKGASDVIARFTP
ncbi:MAG: phosphatidylserine decarboxylase [Sulfuricaulis sp.]|nr:phosphatidylserine decarboxylase [Sulfuricaulis sp.]